ncbi:MAG: EVE domain-containing protein [Gemmatimonadales bacterium]|nr:EVE domain-containing protein [Gemmatimonadales bacterium]MYG48619.1 EVE domain-containing protein [Gemmatimonadales bacterium]MYK01723.1 EVE domain-containing protein [Candidatus Palauibacter ramosifaciens]
MPIEITGYWLAKTEPHVYSIDDLALDGETEWDGVRNYQVRNFMRDRMNPGEKVLIYHSNTRVLGVYGVAEVAGPAHPDSTQFDSDSHYFDPKSSRENPRWWCPDFRYVETFGTPVTRQMMKETAGLETINVMKRGMRLSVMPVTEEEFEIILRLGRG